MTQQPFSRPGAIDLSSLRRPPPARSGATGATGGATGAGAAPAPGAAAYSTEVTQETFQAIVESSLVAPVLLVFYSATRMPESAQMARDLASVAEEFEGRFLAGLVDIDAEEAIAQAVQLQSVPFVFAVIEGRPQPLIADLLSLDGLRGAVNQVMQQLTTQGITGRHQARQGAAPVEESDGEPAPDPRYLPAHEALEANDFALAVSEYENLLKSSPADSEAVAGLAMARLLLRTDGVDAAAARSAADADPDDLDAQTLAADVDLLDADLDAAFSRLVDLVRRTAGDERNRVRDHLVGLFTAVGNDDPRVVAGRRNLASALF